MFVYSVIYASVGLAYVCLGTLFAGNLVNSGIFVLNFVFRISKVIGYCLMCCENGFDVVVFEGSSYPVSYSFYVWEETFWLLWCCIVSVVLC